ncbi:MAG TPA: lipase maturation factor family protein, partial [Myxococcaceae bacterium]|nr:lipase maturation factor family protein [Myxococcaceae bacterium]
MAAALFLRGLGATFFIAFASLWVQLEGLIGSRGISPVAEFLPWAYEQLGWRAYARIPTLCWISASDGFLGGLCAAGVAFSLLVVGSVAQRWSLLVLWALYLSLVTIGDVFLQYQWDSLLLETAFFSIFLASPRKWPSRAVRSSPVALWLLRWLLFRLMFLSGAVKLASGDSAWRNLSALRFHYWTQPLPTWTSYYANLLPDAVQVASAVVMFAIELGVPFLIFGPRVARLFAAAAIAFLQLVIAATGNYGFFNLLALLLCLLLIDDVAALKILPRSFSAKLEAQSSARAGRRAMQIAFVIAAAFFVLVSIAETRFWRPPAPFSDVLAVLQPFRSINSYGLFAVMTTRRPEILVQGSDDGRSWHDYQFKWKPGDLKAAPRFVAPHQPRLDWQMWFAALGTCARNPWFIRFQERLLQGSPPVARLLAADPFPRSPPRYIRSLMYDYRFAS